MNDTMKVLFVTPEAEPLTGAGPLGEFGGALPAALRRLGVDVRLFLPGYPAVLDAVQLSPVCEGLPVLARFEKMRLLGGTMPDGETPLYVLDSPALFRRDGGLYQNSQGQDWRKRWGATGHC